MQHELPHEQVIKEGRRDGEGEREQENPQHLELFPHWNRNGRFQGLRKGYSPASRLTNVRCWEEKGPSYCGGGFSPPLPPEPR